VAQALEAEFGNTDIPLDLRQLRNNKPMTFDVACTPAFDRQLTDDDDLSTKTIYGILEEEFDIPVKKGSYRIEAANAHDYLAENLEVSKGTALLLIDRLSLTIGEKPIYYQKRY